MPALSPNCIYTPVDTIMIVEMSTSVPVLSARAVTGVRPLLIFLDYTCAV